MLLAGLPSREDSASGIEGGYPIAPVSIPYAIYADTAWNPNSSSNGTSFPNNPNTSTNFVTYSGADQFTVAEYGHPLVAVLDAGDNALSVTGLTTANSGNSGVYQFENFSFAGGVSQYGDQSYTYSSIPSGTQSVYNPYLSQYTPVPYSDNTFIQTANTDNQSTTFSLSFTLDANTATDGGWAAYESAATTVDILYDNAITTKPSWLTGSFTSTGQSVTNSNGHTFTVYASNSTYGPDSTVALGANDGNSGSEMYSVLLVSPSVQTEAYIAKEATSAAANSGAGLGTDGTTINGTLAGVAGSNYIVDDTTTYGGDDLNPAVPNAITAANSADTVYNSSTNPSGNIYTQTNIAGPNIDAPAESGSEDNVGDIAGYGSWGNHSGTAPFSENGSGWPLAAVVFTGTHNSWWAGMTIESYDGDYNDVSYANPVTVFAPTAFGGTNYSNTPVAWVGTSQEPGLGGVEGSAYMGSWSQGLTSLEAAWAGHNHPSFIAVTDIQLEQYAPLTPAAPTLTTPTVVSSNQINLSWTPGTQPNSDFSASGYGIWRAPDVGGSPGTYSLVGSVGGSTTTYSDTSLTAGTKYWYKIEAYFNGDTSQYSAQAAAITLVAPSNLVAYWRLDESTVGNVYDTATGGQYADNGYTTGPPTVVTGKAGCSSLVVQRQQPVRDGQQHEQRPEHQRVADQFGRLGQERSAAVEQFRFLRQFQFVQLRRRGEQQELRIPAQTGRNLEHAVTYTNPNGVGSWAGTVCRHVRRLDDANVRQRLAGSFDVRQRRDQQRQRLRVLGPEWLVRLLEREPRRGANLQCEARRQRHRGSVQPNGPERDEPGADQLQQFKFVPCAKL